MQDEQGKFSFVTQTAQSLPIWSTVSLQIVYKPQPQFRTTYERRRRRTRRRGKKDKTIASTSARETLPFNSTTTKTSAHEASETDRGGERGGRGGW